MKAYACDKCSILMLEDDVVITKFMEIDAAKGHKVVITIVNDSSNEYCKKCAISLIETALEMLKNDHKNKKPDKKPRESGSPVENKKS